MFIKKMCLNAWVRCTPQSILSRFDLALWEQRRQCGATLLELVVAIVIVSGCLMAILNVLSWSSSKSTTALLAQQSANLAESMLHEVQRHPFLPTGFVGAATAANRASFDDIFDYHGLNENGAALTGIAAFSSYQVSISVIGAPLSGIVSTNAAWIQVDVTDPLGQVVSATGYRVID
ncbi:MAG: type II secretion system protein [Zetaproteobacteria bacterium]|nr:type II secretion system protein [Zetaproteobacteria bacterium]